MQSRHIAFLKLFITAMLWGTTYVLVSMGLEEIGPMMLAAIRYTLAGLLMLPLVKYAHLDIRHYKKYYWRMVLMGVLAFTLGNGLLGFALAHLSSTSVSLMSNLSAPLIMIFGAFLLKEIPAPIQIIGVLAVFIGLVLYFNPGEWAEFNLGYVYMFISVLSFTAYNLLNRSISRDRALPFLIQTSVPFIIGGGIMLVFAIAFEGLPIISIKGFWIIMFLVLFNSVIGYTLYNQALVELTAIEANIILRLGPFFTAFYAWILLGETISFTQVLAMLVVFVGIYLVQKEPILIQT